MLITSHGHSDVGFVRDKNEDSFVVDEKKGIFAVADGVGGLPYGIALGISTTAFNMLLTAEIQTRVDWLLDGAGFDYINTESGTCHRRANHRGLPCCSSLAWPSRPY